MIIQLIGWIGTFIVLGGYFLSTRRHEPKILHVANVVGACFLVPTQIYLGVMFAAFISLMFGLIAAYALFKN